MTSPSTRWRQWLKEINPAKYADNLEKEKERSRLRRLKKKQKYASEPITRATEQERDRERELARNRWCRYYQRKKEAAGRPSTTCRKRAAEAEPADPSAKRPRDMTPSEFKEHKRQLRASSRAREGPQKKRRIREKNAKYKREKRLNKRMKSTPQPLPSEKSPKSLRKSDYNFVSKFRQKLKKRAQTPVHFAMMMKNIVSNSLTPKKRQAVKDTGITVLKPKASRALFGNVKKLAQNVRKRLVRKQRKDALSIRDKQKVRIFFLREDISRVLPHKRYARKDGPGYVMQQTLKNAFEIFKKENPNIKIGYSMFTMLRPKFVRKICSTFADSCLCVYCVNVSLKIQAINRCIATLQLDSGMRLKNEQDLVNLLLCSKGEAKFANANCVQGKCSKCSDIKSSLLKHYSAILDIDPKITWSSWRRKTVDGKLKREPVVRQSPFSVLLEEFLEDIIRPANNTTFPKHLFVAHWQYHQYRHLKENLRANQVMMVMDFAENRKSSYQDEIKSAHFDKRQITLHPVITFYRDRQTGQLVRHALNFLSDDIVHDHNAVHHFTEKSIEFLSSSRILLPDSEVIIFSDGCAAQYKGKGTFADLTHYKVPIQRVFFGSEHGKGEADGETGTLSKSLETAVLCRQTVIRNAADLYRWSVDNLRKEEPLSKRNFFLVEAGDIQRDRLETQVKPVKGSRAFHQVVKVAPFVLKARSLACFCPACQRGDIENCSNKHFVDVFTTYKLQHIEPDNLDLGASPDHKETPNLTRQEFFGQCQQKLIQAKAKGFKAFVQCAMENKALADTDFQLNFVPEEPCFTRIVMDNAAASFLPQDFHQTDRFPHETAAQGNCLPLSLSIAVFGEGSYHQELRVRICWELALNKHIYLSPLTVSNGTDLDGCSSLHFYHQTGDYAHLNLFSAYEDETMAVAGEYVFMGPWQLHAAASILQRAVHCIYPHISDGPFRQELNRTILPTASATEFPVYILWTCADSSVVNPAAWTVNHFVPLVKEGREEDEAVQRSLPRIGDFVKVTYKVMKKSKSYMGVVSPAPEYMCDRLTDKDLVVQFLTRSANGEYYVFPRKEQIYAVSLTETEMEVVDPPTINQRGHYKFNPRM